MDRKAFDRMVREHGPSLEAAALRLTRSLDAADDLVQDTFERALRRPPVTSCSAEMHAWLITVMRNLFRDRWRTERVRRRSLAAVRVYLAAAPPDAIDPDAEPRRWEGMDIERVYASFAALSVEHRSVIELHTRQGLKYREIARRLDIPDATVGSRLHRARHQLRELLDGDANGGGH